MILIFGSLNIDLVALVPVIPGPGRTVLAPSYATHYGGKGANQAVAAARIAGPGKVFMAGRVGRDAFGDGALHNLAANGVDTSLVVKSDDPTGCAFITVDPGGENAITVASGANMTASAADVPVTFFGADTVLVLQMEVPFAQSLEVARRTKSASGTVVWNLAPVPEQMTSEMIRDLLAATDYLLVNEHEALDAAAAIGFSMSDFGAAAGKLAKAGDLTCVVTAGAEGAVADDSRRFPPSGPLPEHQTRRHDGSRRYLRWCLRLRIGRESAAAKGLGGRMRGRRLKMSQSRCAERYAHERCDKIDCLKS